MKLGKVSNRKILKQTAVLLLCVAAGWYLKSRLTPQMPMMGAAAGDPYVLVQQVQQRNISPKKSYIGHVEAIKAVDLRPQVTGYVEKVLFQEGSLVMERNVSFFIQQRMICARSLAVVECFPCSSSASSPFGVIKYV